MLKSIVLLCGLSLMPFRLMAADAKKPEILVAAAASLRDVFEEIAPLFEQANPTAKVTFQFAASGSLQQQIEQGAPVDVFVSAAQKQVDALLQKDLLVKDSVQNLFSNALVLVVPKGKPTPKSIQDLKTAAYKRIAIGEKATVPAGQYAEQWIEKNGLTAVLKDRLVPASNVRQVLNFVETGNADAGFVYKTDALTSSAVVVAAEAEAKEHDPIIYPIALVKKSSKLEIAQAFAKFLKTDTARRIFAKRGFILPAEKAS